MVVSIVWDLDSYIYAMIDNVKSSRLTLSYDV